MNSLTNHTAWIKWMALPRMMIVIVLLFSVHQVALATNNFQGSQIQSNGPMGANILNQDKFGYTLKDSNDHGGPVYNWIDIAMADDYGCWILSEQNYTCGIPIGFDFPFYGKVFHQLYFNIDGYISFGQGWGTVPIGGIPGVQSPNNEIAIFGSDLTNNWKDTHIYYQTLANPTRFVLQVNGINAGYYQNPITFEAILYPNGDILVQYQTLLGRTTSFVGLENELGTDGLLYGRPLNDGLAIRYSYPFGILFRPSESSAYGRLGSTVTHQIALENKTGYDTSFIFSYDPQNEWPVHFPNIQTPIIPKNDTTNINIQVTVPTSVSIGDWDVAQIQATAVSSPTITGTLILTTTATSDDLGYIPVSGSYPEQYAYLAKIDSVTQTWAGRITLEQVGCIGAYRSAIPPDGKTIWVSCYDSNQVIILDKDQELIKKVIGNVPSPTGIAFSLDGKFAFVGSLDTPQVSIIRRYDFAISALPVSAASDTLVAHPYLPSIYVTNRSGDQVSVIDSETLGVSDTINIGTVSYYAAVSNNGRWVYISSSGTDTVYIVEAATNQIVDTIISGGTTGYFADVLTSLQDGKLFLNNNSARWLEIYDAADYSLEEPITLPTAGEMSWLTSLGLNCDGSRLYIVNPGATFDDMENHLWVMDTQTYSLTASLSMNDYLQDGHHDPGASDISLCPQLDARPKLLPGPIIDYGQPGETQVYTFTVTNQSPSPISDEIILETSGSTWPVTLSAGSTGTLQWGESFTFTLTVDIPMNAVLGNQADTAVVARSTNNAFNRYEVHVISRYALTTFLPVLAKR
jgi:YVTN family beta-propeller protein